MSPKFIKTLNYIKSLWIIFILNSFKYLIYNLQYPQTKLCSRGKIFQYPNIIYHWCGHLQQNMDGVDKIGTIVEFGTFSILLASRHGFFAGKMLLLLILYLWNSLKCWSPNHCYIKGESLMWDHLLKNVT